MIPSECAEMLRGFFERDMIGEDGQDVLRYDPSLDEPVHKGIQQVELIEQFQKQRFLPLLECLPDLRNSVHGGWE